MPSKWIRIHRKPIRAAQRVRIDGSGLAVRENANRMPAKPRIEKILPPTAASFVYQIKRDRNFGAGRPE